MLHRSSYFIQKLCLLLLLCSLSSCGFFSSSEPEIDTAQPPPEELQAVQPPAEQAPKNLPRAPAHQAKTKKIPVEQKQDPVELTRSDLEILWQVPKESVDGFIVHYGYEQNQLNFERRLLAPDLEQVNDPKSGPLFRYVLTDLPVKRHLYFTVSTFKGQVVSAPSAVVEVE